MAGKIQSLDIEVRIEPLDIDNLSFEDRIQIETFSCGKDADDDVNPHGYNRLNHFFNKEMLLCSKYHYFSAYCVKEAYSGKIVALFTLANDSVVMNDKEDKEDFLNVVSSRMEKEYVDTFKKQTSFPAVNIAHLGVKEEYQRKGIGLQILDFIVLTFGNYHVAGCQFITVDSLNNSDTNKFYLMNGFLNLTDKDMYSPTRRMYLYLRLFD